MNDAGELAVKAAVNGFWSTDSVTDSRMRTDAVWLGECPRGREDGQWGILFTLHTIQQIHPAGKRLSPRACDEKVHGWIGYSYSS